MGSSIPKERPSESNDGIEMKPAFVISLAWLIFAALEGLEVLQVTSFFSDLFVTYFSIISAVLASGVIFYTSFSIEQRKNKEASKGLAFYILFAPIGLLLTIDPINTITVISMFVLFVGTMLGMSLGYMLGQKKSS